jgi:SET domain-containing protein
MPPAHGIRVIRSKIHGYGVEATREFAPGDLIAEVEGIVYAEDELEDDDHALWLRDGWLFDMVCQMRWINHSCEPNASVECDLDADGTGWARIVARTPIHGGNEITFDYAFPAELAMPCHCGAPTCRGLIIDAG